MSEQRYYRGYKIDYWVLEEFLGKGGNADVWRAKNCQNDSLAAIKIIKTTNINSEPFKRFKAEVEVLHQLGDHPGILPLIDFSLPAQIKKQTPGWLAMPIATKIVDALGTEPSLVSVVKAIATIARTLYELSRIGIHHRDIKPENLYEYNGHWVIGDFGLVEYPDKEALTENDHKLGPLYYLAPEMLSNPQNAAGEPADVYSLAKTLWVLATDQKYPPPGEQRVEDKALILSTYTVQPRSYLLDRLIERSTRFDPAGRPSMEDFSGELLAWLESPLVPTSPGDFSAVANQIKALIEPKRRADAQRQEQIHEATASLEIFRQQLQQINALLLKEGLPTSGVGSNRTVLDAFRLEAEIGGPKLIFGDGYCVVLQSPGPSPIYLWSGIGLELFDDGNVHQVAAHLVGRSTNDYKIVWSVKSGPIPLGSAQHERSIDGTVNHLVESLPRALEYYMTQLGDQ